MLLVSKCYLDLQRNVLPVSEGFTLNFSDTCYLSARMLRLSSGTRVTCESGRYLDLQERVLPFTVGFVLTFRDTFYLSARELP
jgi:hypothetical protein